MVCCGGWPTSCCCWAIAGVAITARTKANLNSLDTIKLLPLVPERPKQDSLLKHVPRLLKGIWGRTENCDRGLTACRLRGARGLATTFGRGHGPRSSKTATSIVRFRSTVITVRIGLECLRRHRRIGSIEGGSHVLIRLTGRCGPIPGGGSGRVCRRKS
jgi:hypothetical protein